MISKAAPQGAAFFKFQLTKNSCYCKHKNEIIILDNVSATWLQHKSQIANKSATKIIAELMRKKLLLECEKFICDVKFIEQQKDYCCF